MLYVTHNSILSKFTTLAAVFGTADIIICVAQDGKLNVNKLSSTRVIPIHI